MLRDESGCNPEDLGIQEDSTLIKRAIMHK
jgi:hypothetical protein